MLAKDLIAELQKLPPDTEVLALTPKGNSTPWLSLWEAYPHGRRVLQIVGVGDQLCNYYKVQYVEDGSCNGGDWSWRKSNESK